MEEMSLRFVGSCASMQVITHHLQVAVTHQETQQRTRKGREEEENCEQVNMGVSNAEFNLLCMGFIRMKMH